MIDPEIVDPMEERCAASPEGRGRSEPNKAPNHRTRIRYPQPPPVPSRTTTTAAVSGETIAGERDLEARAGLSPQSGIEREFAERQTLESTLQTQSEFWRQEVTRRVEGYRTRRSRKRLAGEFSMRLDFEASGASGPAMDSLTITVSGTTQSFSSVSEAEEPPASCPVSLGEPAEPETSSVVISECPVDSDPPIEKELTPERTCPPAAFTRDTKLVEFPRSLVFPEFAEGDPDALAEPVLEKLRILDVPEAIGVVPAPLSDIALQPKDEQEEDFAPPAAFELPLRVAAMRVRFIVALVDTLLVVIAAAMFVMVVGQITTGLPQNRMVLMLVAAAAVVFWAAYHYLFLVHAGATPGMALSRVRLSTFEGDYVPRTLRRWRALIMVLSFAALGFGFLWALFDQDNLCWHDKMTRTYLTME
jgi:hypothetical protein